MSPSPLSRIAAGLAIALACGHALGQSTTFGVSLRVLAEPGSAHANDGDSLELPAPPGTQALPRGRHDRRLLYSGSPDEAKRFYDTALPALGFYRTQRSPHSEVWERGAQRTELSFYPVAGDAHATGILIRASDG